MLENIVLSVIPSVYSLGYPTEGITYDECEEILTLVEVVKQIEIQDSVGNKNIRVFNKDYYSHRYTVIKKYSSVFYHRGYTLTEHVDSYGDEYIIIDWMKY